MVVGPEAGRAGPASAAALSYQTPASRAEAGARLRREDVGTDSDVAECKRRSGSSAVQERACVLCPVGAKTRDFQRETVVAVARTGRPTMATPTMVSINAAPMLNF